jgi:hypothetical protein
MRAKSYTVAVPVSLLALVWAGLTQADTATPDKQHLFAGIWSIDFTRYLPTLEAITKETVNDFIVNSRTRVEEGEREYAAIKEHPKQRLTIGFNGDGYSILNADFDRTKCSTGDNSIVSDIKHDDREFHFAITVRYESIKTSCKYDLRVSDEDEDEDEISGQWLITEKSEYGEEKRRGTISGRRVYEAHRSPSQAEMPTVAPNSPKN